MSGKERMFAKIVLASKAENSTALPLITMHLHYPDIIHGEVMTHRVFSRNARSMRAVPIATMVKEVREDPFVPWHWGKNQRGMQASEENTTLVKSQQFTLDPHDGMYFKEDLLLDREEAWRRAAKAAADWAEAFGDADYHKQVANRIIAPYTWKHTLITSTSWANFLHLRDHDDAEPHFHDLAILVRQALDGAEYQWLKHGDWHLPYVTKHEKTLHNLDTLRKLSVARSARISYAPFDGDFSVAREIERYELLVGSSPLHASPTEHQATPDRGNKLYMGNGRMVFENPGMGGNLGPGWIQFRKTLDGEYVKDLAA